MRKPHVTLRSARHRSAWQLLPPLVAVFLGCGSLELHAEINALNRDTQRPELVGESVSLLTLNMAHGRGKSVSQLLVGQDRHRANLDVIAELLARYDADIVALQEADAPSLWSGRFDHVEYLVDQTDYGSVVHGYHARAWPFTFGAVLMSTAHIGDAISQRFPPSFPTATKGYVRGRVAWREAEDAEVRHIEVVSAHLDFSRRSVRETQVREMVEDLRDIRSPLVVMGDFNADWSSDGSAVRVLAAELGLQAFSPQADRFYTYKKNRRLDWILVSDELVFTHYDIVPDVVSDHLAVIARIGWKGD